MEWSTHALSGVVSGYVVTGGDWRGALVGGIAGVIPDLDEYRSKFGKVFFPISFVLNKTFGHRTLTHSLLFAILLTIILYPFTESWVWLSTFVGILAHIAGDMLTGKVKLFYPFQRSVGIAIHPSMFKPIDRIAKLILMVGLFLIILHKFPNVLSF